MEKFQKSPLNVNGFTEKNVFLERTLEKRIEFIKKQTQLTSLQFYFNAPTDGEISETPLKLSLHEIVLSSVFVCIYAVKRGGISFF